MVFNIDFKNNCNLCLLLCFIFVMLKDTIVKARTYLIRHLIEKYFTAELFLST